MRTVFLSAAIALFLLLAVIVKSPVYSATSWQHISSGSQQLPVPQTSTQQTASLILDIDKDGDKDFVIASRGSPKAVVWFRRNNNGWDQYIIDNSSLRIEAGGDFYDIDSDGDLDVVFASDNQSNFIYWWENPYPNFSPTQTWNKYTIKNTGADKHHDMAFGDVDGDSKSELVFWNQSEPGLFVAEIPANPKTTSSWPRTKIYTSTPRHEGLDLYDIDGDGKLDISGGGVWFKHTTGTTFQANIIDSTRAYTRTAVGQFIPGGRAEVVLSAGDEAGTIDIYSWNGNSWTKKSLSAVDHGHSLEAADINSDGKLDIFSAEMRVNGTNPGSKIRLFINDGAGNFTTEVAATGFDNHESKLGDLDNDGDLDILGKPYNYQTPGLNIWLQQGNIDNPTPTSGGGGGLDKWQRRVIDSAMPWTSLFIYGADLDGDNKKDIVTGGWWYKNPGSSAGNWGTRRVIGSPLNNAALLEDFDKDGDLDIFGSQWDRSAANPKLSWAQNTGNGIFTIKNNVSQGSGDFLQGADFSVDNNKKIALSWHRNGGGVQEISIPADPVTQNWTIRTASTTNQQEDISSGDIDKDGDQDLLLGTKWLQVNGSNWTTFTLFNTTDLPDRNELVDMDRDGKLDALVGYEAISQPGKLAWYKQGATATALWTEKIIATDVVGPMSIDVADMDGDSDLDVVVGEHNTKQPTTAKLYVYENMGGANSWRKHLIFTGDEHHMGAQLSDIDSDGDLDILSMGWTHGKVLLYENLGGSGPNPTSPQATNTLFPTDQVGGTKLNLTLLLHGIGKGGDSVNPQSSGNNNPIRPQRAVSVELFSANNQSIGVFQGVVSFDDALGSFKGNVTLSSSINSGSYTAKVKVKHYMAKAYTGIINITKNKTNTLSVLSLITGDSNDDNNLSVLDYNIILDCYSESNPAKNCSGNDKKLSADFTDDGSVNQFDYNLFLRELSAQGADGYTTPQPTSPNPTNTPPQGATNTPRPSPTNPPDQTGEEKIVFNDDVQFTQSDGGFHVLKSAGSGIPGLPVNWLSPTNYYNGTWHFRYVIHSHPTNTAGKLQVCIWNMPGFKPESCGGKVAHQGVGTYTYSSVPSSWWKKDGVPLNFSNSSSFLIRVILLGLQSGGNDCIVSNKNVPRPCPEQFQNFAQMKFKLTIVMVPQGQTFSGWNNY